MRYSIGLVLTGPLLPQVESWLCDKADRDEDEKQFGANKRQHVTAEINSRWRSSFGIIRIGRGEGRLGPCSLARFSTRWLERVD